VRHVIEQRQTRFEVVDERRVARGATRARSASSAAAAAKTGSSRPMPLPRPKRSTSRCTDSRWRRASALKESQACERRVGHVAQRAVLGARGHTGPLVTVTSHLLVVPIRGHPRAGKDQ
jgi:hypothetical protein